MSVRVLMVAATYFPSLGGVETHVHEVARRLAAHGVEPTIVATDLSGELPRREVIEGLDVRRVAAYPAKRDWRFAPGVDRAVGEGDWDLVHVQGYHTFVAPQAMLAARRRRLPYVVTMHSGGPVSGLRDRVRTIQVRALRPLMRSARRVVAVSDWERDTFARTLRLPRDRFAVIPNGAELPPPSARAAAARGNGGPHVVSIGRLVEYKGHHRAIAAMPAILRERPGATLQIVGSGPYEPELQRQARALGLGDAVSIGSVPGSDRQAMADIVGTADVVVLLSEYESQGIAVFEALSLGRPVVVADATALTELGRAGLARPVALHASPETTAAAILAESAAGANGNGAAHGSADRAWSWDDCARQVADLYRSVLGGRAS